MDAMVKPWHDDKEWYGQMTADLPASTADLDDKWKVEGALHR